MQKVPPCSVSDPPITYRIEFLMSDWVQPIVYSPCQVFVIVLWQWRWYKVTDGNKESIHTMLLSSVYMYMMP